MEGIQMLYLMRISMLTAAFVLSSIAQASTTLTLTKEFIEDVKDKATISVDFVVDFAHDRPKPNREDGDIHIAGWSDDIGLTTIAEIMNSRRERDAVDRSNQLEGRSREANIVGVWRIWPEHGGDHVFVQNEPANEAFNTNPDHIFEMHPLTLFDGIEVGDSIGRTRGYKYKDAETAFHRYENTRFNLECFDDDIQMTMSMVGFNYTDFTISLNEDVTHEMQDGGKSVFAAISDNDGELLISNLRLVLVPGTEAFLELENAQRNDEFRVIGMPRLSLALVSWRCENADDKPFVLDWNIPYEMVILAIR
jgi:hypothetical protein